MYASASTYYMSRRGVMWGGERAPQRYMLIQKVSFCVCVCKYVFVCVYVNRYVGVWV